MLFDAHVAVVSGVFEQTSIFCCYVVLTPFTLWMNFSHVQMICITVYMTV